MQKYLKSIPAGHITAYRADLAEAHPEKFQVVEFEDGVNPHEAQFLAPADTAVPAPAADGSGPEFVSKKK